MLVYSKKIIQFINEIKRTLKEILIKEVHLKASDDYFYDRLGMNLYPIRVVIYNDSAMLGYFDPECLELGFHSLLMHSSREQLHNIIRHELAHYITFINYGPYIQAHGDEFRAFCNRMVWKEDVYKASICLDNELKTSDVEDNAVLRKVQKLMALATSSNTNEAEQAMIKSQQLLMNYNIDSKYIENDDDDEKVFLKRVLKFKKKNQKAHAISRILQTFLVSTVYSRKGEFTYLEIVGSAVNVEIANYVAGFLDHELDKLWSLAQKEHTHLKGVIAKNSFFMGIANGYCNKINSLKKEYSRDASNALMIIEKKLTEATGIVYPRLTSSRSHASCCQGSSALGEQVGRKLSINPGVSSSKKDSETYIGYKAPHG
jgi:predicted SprT family Zn-dependent metalloprotease